MSVWKWSQTKEKAAFLVALDKETDEEIASQVGIRKSTLEYWKKRPEFASRVQEHLAAFKRTMLRRGIAKTEYRVAALQDRWERMRRIVEERAVAEDVQNIAGGQTGLITHTVKGIGKGDDFRVVDVYEVDTGLLKELREHEKQAAQELGQWVDKKELGGPDGGPLVLKHDYDELRKLPPDELQRLYREALDVPGEDRE